MRLATEGATRACKQSQRHLDVGAVGKSQQQLTVCCRLMSAGI